MKARLLALWVGLGSGACVAQDFAWQWPIELPEETQPAYLLTLDESVYAALADPLLRDLVVLDPEGRSLPAAMQPLPAAALGQASWHAVPWFLLPGEKLGQEPGALQGRFESPGVALSWSAAATAEGAAELLLDLGAEAQSVGAVRVEAAGDEPMWRARIEALSSDDLQAWSTIAPPTALYRLRQEGHHLEQLRIELQRRPGRFLRLRHAADSPGGAISAVEVERRERVLEVEPPLRWLRLAGTASSDGRSWVYRSSGPMRIEAWNLDAGAGNWVLRADLSSRADEHGPWRRRSSAERYQWQIEGERVGSPAVALGGLRERFWRIELAEPARTPPDLLLAYRPDRLLFLAEVPPPYRLAAGSASARRTDAPTAAVVSAMRQRHGASWQPLEARLGGRATLAGEAALVPQRAPLDWRGMLLWAVLLAVAGSVVVIALKLLRQPPTAPS